MAFDLVSLNANPFTDMKRKMFFLLLLTLVLTSHLCVGQKLPSSDLPKSGSEFYCVAINPDNRIIASGDQHGKIYLWDATSKSIVNTLEGENVKIIALTFSNDGGFLAAAGKDNSIAIWSTRHGVKEKIRTPGGGIDCFDRYRIFWHGSH